MISGFTYHLVVCLQINLEAPLLQGGRGLWEMNTKPLEDTTTRSRFQQKRTRKENNRTWLRGGRSMSDGKAVSFSSKKGLQGLEKI